MLGNQLKLALGLLVLSMPLKLTAQPQPVADADAIRVQLVAEQETTLVAQMNGRIDVLNASLGKSFAKGRQIVAMECGESRARLHMAEAELASANETLTAKNSLKQLNAAGDMEVALALAAVDKAKGVVSLGLAQVAYCTVNAPFNGRVAHVYIKQYQGVNVGTPLVDLVSNGPLKLRLNVPSHYLKQLKVGTPFEITVNETGKTYLAKVTAINARIDAVAQTVELEARINDKTTGLLAGMSGIAHFLFKP